MKRVVAFYILGTILSAEAQIPNCNKSCTLNDCQLNVSHKHSDVKELDECLNVRLTNVTIQCDHIGNTDLSIIGNLYLVDITLRCLKITLSAQTIIMYNFQAIFENLFDAQNLDSNFIFVQGTQLIYVSNITALNFTLVLLSNQTIFGTSSIIVS